MSQDDTSSIARLGLRRGACLFAMCWLVFASAHYEEPGWNVNSRFALTRAIVERGSFIVDGLVNGEGRDYYTEDRAFYEGHYYSDKIIGVSLLGVPARGMVRLVEIATGWAPSVATVRYWTTVGSISVCAALAATVIASLLLALGATAGQALLLTVAASFGTMLWGYSALFYSYVPAILFALTAYNVLLRARLAGGVGPLAMALAGVAIGASLLCEYTLGIVAAALGVYAIVHGRPRWGVVYYGLAALAVLSVFAVYTLICFDEMCIPYKHLENKQFLEGMSEGVQGIEGFRLSTLYYITIHPYRGVFWLSPFLLLSLVAVVRMGVESRRFRIDAFMIGAIFLGYVAFNSSYYMWWGGWSMGPRHLIPGLPLMVLPLLWLLRWNRVWAWATRALVMASVCLVAVPTLVDPQVPQGYTGAELFDQPVGLVWEEIERPRALFAKLQTSDDALTAYLRSNVGADMRGALRDGLADGIDDEALGKALAWELNGVLTSGYLYAPDRFAGIELSRESQRLLDAHPEGVEGVRLNRRLLAEAYSDEIASRGRLYNYRSPVFTVSWPAFLKGDIVWNSPTPYGLRSVWVLLILVVVWTGGTTAFLKLTPAQDADE